MSQIKLFRPCSLNLFFLHFFPPCKMTNPFFKLLMPMTSQTSLWSFSFPHILRPICQETLLKPPLVQVSVPHLSPIFLNIPTKASNIVVSLLVALHFGAVLSCHKLRLGDLNKNKIIKTGRKGNKHVFLQLLFCSVSTPYTLIPGGVNSIPGTTLPPGPLRAHTIELAGSSMTGRPSLSLKAPFRTPNLFLIDLLRVR